MGRPFKCPYCGEGRSVSKGVRRTKTLGVRRLRKCKACGRKFTPKNQQPLPEASEASEPQAEPGEQLAKEPEEQVAGEPEPPVDRDTHEDKPDRDEQATGQEPALIEQQPVDDVPARPYE